MNQNWQNFLEELDDALDDLSSPTYARLYNRAMDLEQQEPGIMDTGDRLAQVLRTITGRELE